MSAHCPSLLGSDHSPQWEPTYTLCLSRLKATLVSVPPAASQKDSRTPSPCRGHPFHNQLLIFLVFCSYHQAASTEQAWSQFPQASLPAWLNAQLERMNPRAVGSRKISPGNPTENETFADGPLKDTFTRTPTQQHSLGGLRFGSLE